MNLKRVPLSIPSAPTAGKSPPPSRQAPAVPSAKYIPKKRKK